MKERALPSLMLVAHQADSYLVQFPLGSSGMC